MKKRKEQETLKVKFLNENAMLPKRGTPQSVGYDLCSAENKTIASCTCACVGTGLAIAVPVGTYGRIVPHSSLASKPLIDVREKVIDPDYRGEVKIVIFNHGKDPFVVRVGDRIAQIICEQIRMPLLEKTDDLDITLRGNGGFGSTDIVI